MLKELRHGKFSPNISSWSFAILVEQQQNRDDDLSTSPEHTLRFGPSKEMNNAFVTATILGSPVDLLVDSGACISVIDAAFLDKVFSEKHSPIIIPSTYPAVGTVNGEHVPTIGKINTTLSFHGRKFPCEFHVIENMPHNAVLGRDFLVANGANSNFAKGTLKLHNTKPLKLTIKASHFQPVASLLQVQESKPAYRNQEKDVDLAATLDHSLVQNSSSSFLVYSYLFGVF